jgi:hypothetical protein
MAEHRIAKPSRGRFYKPGKTISSPGVDMSTKVTKLLLACSIRDGGERIGRIEPTTGGIRCFVDKGADGEAEIGTAATVSQARKMIRAARSAPTVTSHRRTRARRSRASQAALIVREIDVLKLRSTMRCFGCAEDQISATLGKVLSPGTAAWVSEIAAAEAARKPGAAA